MVYMGLGPLKEEEAMMIDQLGPTLKRQKRGDIPPAVIVHELIDQEQSTIGSLCSCGPSSAYAAGEQVESGRVEFICPREIGHTHPEVTQLVHRSRS
jgi:hypothetical protein